MHIRLVAVGDRQPSWVDDAVDTYTSRFPRQWKFRIDSIATAKRSRNTQSDAARAAEGEQILSRIESDEQVVLLDERGKQLNSPQFARSLASWQADGRDLCFIIGGPDGVSTDCSRRADFTWSLSSLTLPHGLARVLFSEQLYRAWTLQSGHPYHRN